MFISSEQRGQPILSLPCGEQNRHNHRVKHLKSTLAIFAAVAVPLAFAKAQVAHIQSSEAKARYELAKEIETDKQKAAFYAGVPELESALNTRGFPRGIK